MQTEEKRWKKCRKHAFMPESENAYMKSENAYMKSEL